MNIALARLRNFVERYTAAWCSNDPSSVASFFSANGSLQINAAAPAVGRSAIREVVRGFMAAFPDLRVSMDEALIQGNRAICHWTLTGTNTGPGGTGQQVRISGFEAWEFGVDELIFESRGHFDEALYQRQLQGAKG